MRLNRVSQSSRAVDRVARFGKRASGLRHVYDGGLVLAIDRRGNRYFQTRGSDDDALVPRLTSPGGIKDCTVENDAAALVDLLHDPVALLEIGVVAKEQERGHVESSRLEMRHGR